MNDDLWRKWAEDYERRQKRQEMVGRTAFDPRPNEYDRYHGDPPGDMHEIAVELSPAMFDKDGLLERDYERMVFGRLRAKIGEFIVDTIPRHRWALIQIRELHPRPETVLYHLSDPQFARHMVGPLLAKMMVGIGTVEVENLMPYKKVAIHEPMYYPVETTYTAREHLEKWWALATGSVTGRLSDWLSGYSLSRDKVVKNGYIVGFAFILCVLTVLLSI